jgi:pimeloyl-ACP methyl ester carboxylesterase
MQARGFKRVARLGLTLAALAWAGVAAGQETKEPKPIKVLKPKPLTFETKDGLELAAIYYPSERGREAVPIMLLHDWGGSGADLKSLAEFLQQQGHAVLVPDLRGHGESKKHKSGKELDHSKMPVVQCHNMYKIDVEYCKSYLIKENNAEKVNIEKLCVVGAGLGAVVAMNWAVIDWAWPVVAGQKQGQDVKVLVLLSPPWVEKTVSVNAIIGTPIIRDKMIYYIAAGKKGTAFADASKIHKRLEAARDGTGPEKDLFFHPIETNRQGVELLVPANFKVASNIQQLIKTKLQDKEMQWKERKNPLE